MQDKLQALQIFIRVAQLGSFTKAGASLGLSKTHVSNVVQQLEQHLGCRLLHRTTRSVGLTQDGQLCYDRSLLLLDEYQELESLFQQQTQQISGVLRLDMSTGMARYVLLPHLADFLQQYPNIKLELSSTDRKVDLVAEGFDCVIRVGSVDAEGLVARKLAQLPMRNLASPAYIARFGMPQCLADLQQHQLVHYVSVLGQQNSSFEYTEQGLQQTLAMPGMVTVNNADAYNAACLAGLGIIQAPVIGVASQLQSGALLDILPQYRNTAVRRCRYGYCTRTAGTSAAACRYLCSGLHNDCSKVCSHTRLSMLLLFSCKLVLKFIQVLAILDFNQHGSGKRC